MRTVRQKFFQNKTAVLCLAIIIGLFAMATFAYVLIPDKSLDANSQHIESKLLPFNSKQYFLMNRKNEVFSIYEYFFGKKNIEAEIPIQPDYYLKNHTIYYKKLKSEQWEQASQDSFYVEPKRFLFGTDSLGRDVWSRLILGSRVSLWVGLIAVIISLIIGTSLGAIAGYYGGHIDKFVLWLINVFWAIPTILLAMAFITGFSQFKWSQKYLVFVAVGLTMWVETARLIRGLIYQIKSQSYIEASHALGYSDSRIIWKHILPNTLSTLIIITASNFASAILIESGLSYLGLGVQPPAPSWGSMLRDYYSYIGTDQSYLALIPGIFIMISVFVFYGLGNGLRDATAIKSMKKE